MTIGSNPGPLTFSMALWGSLLLGCSGCSPAANTTTSKQPATAASTSQSVVSPEVPIELETSAGLQAAQVIYETGKSKGLKSILESLGGGVGLIDYDADGWLDLCFPGGGTLAPGSITGLPTRLLRQQAPDVFQDAAKLARMDAAGHYSHGCSVADYNSDGFDDLLITGYGGLRLWENQGDGTFLDVTQHAQLSDDRWSTSAAWNDVTGDGILDLYVCHYVNWSFANDPRCAGPSGNPDVCPPRQFDGVNDVLYVGTAEGVFEDASRTAGLLPAGKGLGVLISDFDHDGDQDIYVANDTVANFLYTNEGSGTFHEVGMLSGMALDDMSAPNGSMGLALLDYDQDGLPDMWVTNYEDELFALYRNLGASNYQFVSRKVGLNRLGTLLVGFGCTPIDIDLDGREDVAVANGHVVYHPRNAPVKQPRLLMLNRAQGLFEAAELRDSNADFSEPDLGRGVASGDLDRDGRSDLVFSNALHPARLFYNRTHSGAAATSRGLRIRLIGTRSPRNGIGAWAELQTTSQRLLRQLPGGGSYLSTGEQVLQWYWPEDAAPEQLTIHWPSGEQTQLTREELGLTDSGKVTNLMVIEPAEPQGRVTVIRN